MYRDELTLSLTVQSPLHIGSGASEVKRLQNVDSNEGEIVELALLQRAASSDPWLPGSSLKGALKAIAKSIDLPSCTELFGVGGASVSDVPSGRQGCLTAIGAKSLKTTEFIERRNAIHRGTGASKKNHLFARQMVDVGSQFEVRLRLDTRSKEVRDRLREDTLTLLSRFAGSQGHPLGSSKSASFGRVKLSSSSIRCVSKSFAENGWSDAEETTHEVRSSATDPETLTLICEGPYLTKEGEREELRQGQTKDGKPATKKVTYPSRAPVLGGQDGNSSMHVAPRIAGSGVKGALRARAEWLVALMVLRGETFQEVEVKTSAGRRRLDVVQRIFGDEGYRARLDITTNNATRKGVSRHPSIRLDPITQSPYQGVLFEIEADFGVSFDLTLEWFTPPRADEKLLLESLKEDINTNGLKLGMGTTKGFGWFSLNQPQRSEPVALCTAIEKRIKAGLENLSNDMKALRKTYANQLPDPATTVPYRILPADINRVTMPEPQILETWRKTSLHSVPMQEGLSGTLDLDWIFETPVLVGNGLDVRTPQCLSVAGEDTYYLPGSTLKGYLRNMLAAALNTRMTHLNKAELSEEERKQGRTTFDLEAPLYQVTRPSTQADHNPHRPRLDASFEPDFVQALFGFVQEADEKLPEGIDHAHAHLKSRVSFGFAKLISQARVTHPTTTTFTPPKATGAFYDHIGYKKYVPGQLGAVGARNRLPPSDAGTDDMPSTVRFLEPKGASNNLMFRGRLSFHNLTSVELGALMWGLLIQANLTHRHQIGMGKPFGFGQCFCANLDLRVNRNDGAEVPDLSPALQAYFNASGHDFAVNYGAFETFLNKLGRHSKNADIGKAFLLGFNPAYGSLLRECSGVEARSAGYQTGAMFDNTVIKDRDETGKDFITRKIRASREKIKQTRAANGPSDTGHGRLAALLKNKPS